MSSELNSYPQEGTDTQVITEPMQPVITEPMQPAITEPRRYKGEPHPSGDEDLSDTGLPNTDSYQKENESEKTDLFTVPGITRSYNPDVAVNRVSIAKESQLRLKGILEAFRNGQTTLTARLAVLNKKNGEVHKSWPVVLYPDSRFAADFFGQDGISDLENKEFEFQDENYYFYEQSDDPNFEVYLVLLGNHQQDPNAGILKEVLQDPMATVAYYEGFKLDPFDVSLVESGMSEIAQQIRNLRIEIDETQRRINKAYNSSVEDIQNEIDILLRKFEPIITTFTMNRSQINQRDNDEVQNFVNQMLAIEAEFDDAINPLVTQFQSDEATDALSDQIENDAYAIYTSTFHSLRDWCNRVLKTTDFYKKLNE